VSIENLKNKSGAYTRKVTIQKIMSDKICPQYAKMSILSSNTIQQTGHFPDSVVDVNVIY
jgi:hypothetical protein